MLDKDLAVLIERSPQYISQIISGKKGAGSKLINLLLDKWVDINPSWLISGHGDMMLNYQANDNISDVSDTKLTYNTNNPDMQNVMNYLVDRVRKLEQELESVKQKNLRMESELAYYKQQPNDKKKIAM
jgi:hypothetical protein